MSYVNKTVLVTGSSAGIGAATAIEYAKQGAEVVIVGRNEVNLNNVREKCESFGSKTLVIKADVMIDEDAKRIIDETIKKFGKLDVLVNNAAIYEFTDLTKDDFMARFDRVMNINFRASVFLTHLATPHLIKTKGNIIFISSIAASICGGDSDLISYCSSKAALNRFAEVAALKLSEHGIRVNIISPGPVATGMLEKNMRDKTSIEQWGEVTALKRVTAPEEIADLILFLTSEKARGITGSDFVTDNGVLLKA
ncbi:3-oxoacyl-[acyl-carrier-protein] reductase FabG-like [Battus philenor]|uniref:3-oxoacyl-[acyl-carrier-protein] reductase FabG-like n=1 Tax=Battus philenor TaxID=42288 RepID=UPI0035D08F9F